jgi:acetyl esterase/lipase
MYQYALNRNPINDGGHCDLAYRYASAAGIGTIAMLEYTLTPEARYPTQMIQAVEALRHLLDSGYLPSNIVIAGDSGGGNLAFAVLAHLTIPSPYCAPIALPPSGPESRLRAAMLMAPWVNLVRSNPDYKRNVAYDCITEADGDMFLAAWAPTLDDIYADPLNFPEDKLRNVPVRSLLVTAGSREALCDDLVQLGTRFGVSMARDDILAHRTVAKRSELKSNDSKRLDFRLVVAQDEMHIMPLFESLLGLPEGVMASAIKDFFQGLDSRWSA